MKTANKLKVRKYHKYIGFIFSLLFIYLSITGIVLLYADKFNLSNVFINNSIILKKYNLATPDDVKVYYKQNNIEVVLVKNYLYYNKQYVGDGFSNIVNILIYDNNIIVFEKSRIIDIQYDVTEGIFVKNEVNIKLNVNDIEDVGITKENNIVFKDESDYYYYDSFAKIKNKIFYSSKSNLVEIDNTATLEHLYNHQGAGVSLHKIFTELHNGNFIGTILKILIFIASIALIFMTTSAFLFGLKRRKK